MSAEQRTTTDIGGRLRKTRTIEGAIISVCILVLAIPPPRGFAAVAGDLVQLLVLLGALSIPVWLLVATTDASADGLFPKFGAEWILDALTRMQARVLATLASYAAAILALIVAKLVCVWFEPHQWAWPICHISAGIAGAAVGSAFVSTRHAIFVAGGLQEIQTIFASVRDEKLGQENRNRNDL